jgi:GAF domain-containing protein
MEFKARDLQSDHASDVSLVSGIQAVPTMLDVVCRTTGMGFAAVARVTEDRWVACAVRDEIAFGLQPGGELDVQTTICNEIRGSRELVVIENVDEDAVYCKHHTPARYGLQSYISVPIMLPDGSFFGTLCAIDPKPRRIKNPETLGTFTLFAQLLAFHIDAHERVAESAAVLMSERHSSELREQFVAVLGHDLRNPLASIAAGANLLEKETLSERGRNVVARIQRSVDRMAGLIDDVLDFARGRLGGGIPVERVADVPLGPLLQQVVGELQVSRPERVIEIEVQGVESF